MRGRDPITGMFVSIDDNTTELPPAPTPRAPKGWEPGVVWDGSVGQLSTGPTAEQPGTWDELLRMWDLDPAEVEVIEPVQRRSWEAQTPDGVQRLNYFKADLRRKRTGGADFEQLCQLVRKHRPRRGLVPVGDMAFLHISGDLQVGKADGDGTEGTVRRFLAALDTGAARLRQLRREGLPIGTVYLPWLGDCIEHVRGHYAMQTFTAQLSLTEQVRLARRLMLKQIAVYAPLAERIVVPVVPGNHDENRGPSGEAFTDFGDNWAVDIGAQVSDALAVNPDAFGHVSVVLPKPGELALTLDIAGTVTTMVHGHQFPRGDAMKWWAGQAHGLQEPGRSTVLLAGHLHHLRVQQDGAKTFIQIPALDGGSDWWRHRTGQDSPPGVVTLVMSGSGWSHLEVLR